MSTLTDLVEQLIEAQVPGSTEALRKAELFEVVHDYALNTLQVDPPPNSGSPADTWLTGNLWAEHHMTIIAGTLTRLYAMPNKPWTNPAAAEFQAALFIAGSERGRERNSSAPITNGYTRVMAQLRAAVPGMRDASIHQELFNTVYDFAVNILQKDAPTHGAEPSAWLTGAEYNTHFRLIVAGTLSKIYAQSKKPWSDPGAATYQLALYQQEAATARSDMAAATAVRPSDRLLSNVRSVIPGVKDATLKQELFNTIDEACRKYFIWVESIEVLMQENSPFFQINVPGADIVRVSSITHEKIFTAFRIDNGKIYYDGALTPEVLAIPLRVVTALAPSISVDLDEPDEWIPDDLWGSCHELFLSGTLWRLFVQPNKAYTDTKMAIFHGQRHRRLLSEARQTVQAAGVAPVRSRMIFPRFAI